MYNNNIPQNNNNMQNYNRPNHHMNLGNSNDRFLGGGFFGPFILGGLTGGLIANSRPNYPIYYSPYPYYGPYPYYPYRYY
jgi:hypothetical protein